mmetsp:Transcript_5911/g.7448  ORF Transcript_5911/g.7448 Transcript_5911/m.7448 type:complete len:264 (+) Transcript_5911:323-1114(+)
MWIKDEFLPNPDSMIELEKIVKRRHYQNHPRQQQPRTFNTRVNNSVIQSVQLGTRKSSVSFCMEVDDAEEQQQPLNRLEVTTASNVRPNVENNFDLSKNYGTPQWEKEVQTQSSRSMDSDNMNVSPTLSSKKENNLLFNAIPQMPLTQTSLNQICSSQQLDIQAKKHIEIPNDMVKFLIGKGGKKIRELEAESGARIKVHDNVNSNVSFQESDSVKEKPRSVELQGSNETIVCAERLIMDFLKTVKPLTETKIAKPDFISLDL